MRVMMRAHTVEDTMHDLAELASPILCVFEPQIDHLRKIFDLLGLAFDEKDVTAVDFEALLFGAPGTPQTSITHRHTACSIFRACTVFHSTDLVRSMIE